VVRQIRHWTLSRVFPTIEPGSILTGSGRHREYDEDDIHLVALAVELGRWRLPMELVRRVLGVLSAKNPAGSTDSPTSTRVLWDEAIRGRDGIFLVIQIPRTTTMPILRLTATALDELVRHIDNERYTSAIIISLSRLFARLRT
jgi:hypothetical protein